MCECVCVFRVFRVLHVFHACLVLKRCVRPFRFIRCPRVRIDFLFFMTFGTFLSIRDELYSNRNSTQFGCAVFAGIFAAIFAVICATFFCSDFCSDLCSKLYRQRVVERQSLTCIQLFSSDFHRRCSPCCVMSARMPPGRTDFRLCMH